LHFDVLHPQRSKEIAKRLIEVEKTAKDTVINSQSIYLLIQDSIPNMEAVTHSVGQIGDFYASYGPSDLKGWKKFLDACAEASEGKTWDELVAGTTCGTMISDLANNYHSKISLKSEPRRLTESVGAHLRTLVPVSLLVGHDLVVNYQNAKKAYDNLQNFKFSIPQDAYRLGYFGRSLDLTEIAKNSRHYTDFKTAHFFPLPEYSWHEAMFRTISEPGLSNLIVLNSDVLTAGGWSDSAPVLPLRNLGCDDVIFITRRGAEDSFSQKIASLLGLSDSDRASLLGIEPTQEVSLPSLGLALKESSAVWCTNWNADSLTGGTGIPGMAIDGYSAPLQVNVPSFLQPYKNASANTGLEGCMPPKSL